MFNRILIANRGEIACRIMRTCQRLGIETVAVYSSADADSRHVALADYAVPIGAPSPNESYLRADRIIAAALSSGAQAIHPGYGFLSEKLELIDACELNGITFIGPNREAIDKMGSKIESKRMARLAGVMCVPGYDEDDQSPARLLDEALRIGFPLLIKASAGGGGKGMRRVDDEADFLSMLALARREAQASFGDDRVLLEKFIINPRHLEVQLMGDKHGGLVHLFERECSIQRRFQKVVEEAPANHLPATIAEVLYESALRMGRAMNYDNAGTVEFVLDADQGDKPYFLEVNTRLQVEHGVTEMTTGIDLVELQLRSAFGERLPVTQEMITRKGWAIECRLNAEEPEHEYRASLGPVLDYTAPERVAGVRVDSGLHAKSVVTPYYDSMLAKVLGYGASRVEATKRVKEGIQQLRIEGLRTNGGLLLQILDHPCFSNVLTTRFLEENFPEGPQAEPEARARHMLAVASAWAENQAVTSPVWGGLRGFRIAAPSGHCAGIDLHLTDVSASAGSEALHVFSSDDGYGALGKNSLRANVRTSADGGVVNLTLDGAPCCTVFVKHTENKRWFSWADGQCMVWDIEHALEHNLDASSEDSQIKHLCAMLPGRISEISAKEGQQVASGDSVLTLEAMKLYHTLAAPLTGQVRKIHVNVGDIVSHGQMLVEFELPAETADEK